METFNQVFTGIAAFAAGDAEPAVPHWIKVSPRGRVTARDGRQFDFSPEVLVERFNADGVSVPVDLDHSTIKKAASGDAAPAVGWIEELDARSDGLWARVSWLKEGQMVLGARTHRYLSPAVKTDKEGRAVWLHSVALVASPAISMPAVASSNPSAEGQETMLNEKVAVALGLKADASAEEIAAIIATLRAKADSTEALIAGLQGVMKTLSSEVVTARNRRIEDRVEKAIACGSATPALYDFCVTLANSSEELFEEFCAKIGTPFAYLAKPAITAEQELAMQRQMAGRPVTLSSDAQRLALQLGISMKDLS